MSAPLGLNVGLVGTTGGVGKRVDPYHAHNFLVEIEGLVVGGFSRVDGLESAIETQDVIEGGVNGYVHKVLKGTTHPPLVLQHGLTDVDVLWSWYERTRRGVIKRRNGTITLLDRQRQPVMAWNFADALPVKWAGPSFDASNDSTVAIERLELVHRGLSKPPNSQVTAPVPGASGLVR